MNTSTRRILIITTILGLSTVALLGLGGQVDGEQPTPEPGPGPAPLPPSSPEAPPLVPPVVPGDDQTTPEDDDEGTVPPAPPATPIFTPPAPLPTPTPTPPDTNTANKWAPRHALLEELGYWSGPTNVPASGKTVDAIRAFQEDAEAARNIVQGQSQSAAILSNTYGFISPDGQWGPEVANWAGWARDNYSLFYQAVSSSTGQPPGADSPGNA
jgi:hypothetical protein